MVFFLRCTSQCSIFGRCRIHTHTQRIRFFFLLIVFVFVRFFLRFSVFSTRARFFGCFYFCSLGVSIRLLLVSGARMRCVVCCRLPHCAGECESTKRKAISSETAYAARHCCHRRCCCCCCCALYFSSVYVRSRLIYVRTATCIKFSLAQFPKRALTSY